ncbi:NADPH-dependent FMN reductase [Amycolatopsis sp. lyj-109]|uniref:NADPH-dependent FMN reductase n=1 Tax=Amycolatopsis sp. lyj-109 TaxID=2789287 RepID=UPI00397DCFE5
MTRIGIIIGSTRPGRRAEQVALWVFALATGRTDATFEVVDIAEYDLPHLDEAVPAAMGNPYDHPHTKVWSATISSFDGFVFVTPEYNHSVPGALKNAIDFLFEEWNDKSAGFVSYGIHGGVRAAEHLRLVAGELKIADVRTQVVLSLRADFGDDGAVLPAAHHERDASRMLDEVIAWGKSLKSLREPSARPENGRQAAATR